MNIQEISYLHSAVKIPLQEKFILHNHPDYHELIFLLQGDVTFCVEGIFYPLKPYDIVFAQNNELHQIVCNSITPYERIVVKINTHFFEKYHCEELSRLFTARSLGQHNLIPHISHAPYHLVELFQKVDFYLENQNDIGALCVFTEILTLLNRISPYSAPIGKSQKNINEIINFIHEHRSEPISLTSIADHFYLNKQYLCKIFKAATGYTVNQYINLKRYMLAEELIKQGASKTEAAFEAGFGTYATYYKVRKLYEG
ncbi:AraC family transcriptional regulator [Konateibacter massiliensis]|uniref:AraC family transcriptional regulator n=1 Tax=Konateibacter massiliensis TaxID=2002841 RepID=UPI000C149D9F|nr:AraC family transcriptional regulator [Konateibacter massiliensis]